MTVPNADDLSKEPTVILFALFTDLVRELSKRIGRLRVLLACVGVR